jgi:hypothetical protein
MSGRLAGMVPLINSIAMSEEDIFDSTVPDADT